jgi:two-component system chemotaxis response regulator CheY
MASVANAEVIKRLVVLIADSKSHSRFLLRSMLLQLEVKNLHEAADGAAALDAIDAVSPDVLILDWDLQVVSAREVLRVVRSQTATPSSAIPTIVISSFGQYEAVQEAIGLGAPHFMVWPISPKMLEDRLRGIVADAREAALAYKRGTPPDDRMQPA